MANIGDLVATATLDIAPFMSNTKNLKTHMKSLDSSLKAVENSFKGTGNKLNGLKAIYSQTGRSLSAYQTLLSKQSAHYNKLKAEIGDVNSATAKQKTDLVNAQSAMTSTAAKVAELQTKYSSLAKEIAIQSSVFTKFGNGLQTVGGKLQTVGDKAQSVGSSLTKGLTTPIVAGAGLAVKAAVDYESAFAGVRKTVDASEAGYRKLSDGIRQMAKELPASAAEIAHVAETAGQLGIKRNDILGFTRTMIDMGESTNLSADEAATAIAKIGNILGLTSADYSRFGSSVVALGNNFATTEKDVVEMTNRLAASGKLAGLTAPEILGLATAMSSVGIEAEAGGTAMSQTLTQMGKAVDTGGDKLNKLAEIAGMSAEQFSTTWREKPIEAVEAFIKGLGNLGDEGESASSVLDDLGMSGIRQSNMLKSLGLASDKVSSAVKMSTEAWKENSALSEEAAKRYETTQSKLQILKNKATDVAIELGGPLADALVDAMEAGEPLIQSIADLAKKFSSLDKEQQQQIIKWGLIAAAAGPALSIFGKGVSTLGSVVTGIGKISSGLGKLSGAFSVLKNGSAVIEGAGVAAAGGATKVGLLTSAVGLLGNPVTWGVLATGAAALAVSTWAQKTDEAKKRTAEWGTEVSNLESQQLSKFKTKVDETNKVILDFESGAGSVDAVKNAFDGLVQSIEKLNNEKLAKKIDWAEKLGLSDTVIQGIKDSYGQVTENAQRMTDEVVAIYNRHNGDMSRLTGTEKEIVLNNQNQLIDKQLELMNFSAKERKALQIALNGEFEQLNGEQRQKAISNMEKMMDQEHKSYTTKKKELNNILKSLGQEETQARQEVLNELDALETEHQLKMEGYGSKYVAMQEAIMKAMGGNAQSASLVWSAIAEKMDKYGLSLDKLKAKAIEDSKKIVDSNGMVAKSTLDMSDEAFAANQSWNSLVYDDKNGKVKTNAKEEVQKALQAEGGWKNMEFILKNANLETNAKMTIGEALVANGQWESLSPKAKDLVFKNEKGLRAILESKTSLESWNGLSPEIKNLLANDSDFKNKASVSKQVLENWNSLTPKEKQLLAKDLTSDKAQTAKAALDLLKDKDIDIKGYNKTQQAKAEAEATMALLQNKDLDILAHDKTAGPTQSASQKVNNVKQLNPANLFAKDNTAGPSASAQASVNKPKQSNPASINASDKTANASASANRSVNSPKQTAPIGMFGKNNTGPSVSSTNTSVNSPKQRSPIGMFARNNTAGPVASANTAVNSPRQRSAASIRANDRTSGAVSSAKSAIASVVGKTVNIVTNFIERHLKHAKGTNYHPGGLATVNDQKGSTYRELVTLPSGFSFIPDGRDVTLPLPEGTKVLKASKTKQLFPHYADGIGFENTNISTLAKRIGNVQNATIETNIAQTDSQLTGLLSELINVMKRKDYTSNDSYTLNVNQTGGMSDNRESMERLFKEFAWYIQQQKGRLSDI
ncbi:tail tape measure protein [Streptococcus agalactiae LMG 14747]|uniref:Tail tape measure protein n=1 Tax=Streptococcus agalactiae LMG 14747 TaxID=1154860 RepID=V6Z370_STRAG|nr:tail tape measure protein [Streptococcus agalactiae LMG 14747]